jgi:hypothetical protein
MAWGKKTGGRNFAAGYDPRRNMLGAALRPGTARKRDFIERCARENPAYLLNILESFGLVPMLVELHNKSKPDRRTPLARWKMPPWLRREWRREFGMGGW